jgi:hypothetical protein
VDDEAEDKGVRLRPSMPIRARVAAATIGRWGLCGVTGTPQLRVEAMPDLIATPTTPPPCEGVTEPVRGATAGLSVRVSGLASVVQSSWSGEGERVRLLGPLSLPPQPDVLAEVPTAAWLCAAVKFKDRAQKAMLAVIHQPTERPDICALTDSQRTLGNQPRGDRGRDVLALRLFDVPDDLHLRTGPNILELDNGGPVAGGRMHSEPSLWLRDAPFAEAGYGSTIINLFPPKLIMAKGVALPDMGGGVSTSGTKAFGSLTAKSFNAKATRILVEGGELDLGRNRTVEWDGPRSGGRNPWDRDTATDSSAGSDLFWSMSDIWFMKLVPTGTRAGQLLLFTPGEPQGDGEPDSAFEAKMSSLAVTARIFKVKLGGREMSPGRRAALDAGDWPAKLAVEIQMKEVRGAFAVKMQDLSLIPDQYQDDQSTAGHWWMCAYDAILPDPLPTVENAQFGSSTGTLDLRDAPWDPYWA